MPPRWSLLIVVPIVLFAALLLYLTGGLESAAEPAAFPTSTPGSEQSPTPLSPAVSTTTTVVEPVVPVCEGVTKSVVTAFLAATSAGDAPSAEALFAVDGFGRYIEPPYRIGGEARDRDSLLGYLDARFADGARLTMRSQKYHGGPDSQLVGFGLTAHDEDGDVVSGTGRINCETRKIEVLVLSPPSFDADPDEGE